MQNVLRKNISRHNIVSKTSSFLSGVTLSVVKLSGVALSELITNPNSKRDGPKMDCIWTINLKQTNFVFVDNKE